VYTDYYIETKRQDVYLHSKCFVLS